MVAQGTFKIFLVAFAVDLKKSEARVVLSLFNTAAHLTEKEVEGIGKHSACFVVL